MRTRRSVAAFALTLAATLLTGLGGIPSSNRAVAAAPSTGSNLTKTVTATRTHLVDGKDVPVESRTVSVTVSATTGLKDRQGIAVAWTGAHPTGGIYADPNVGSAARQEYPMVLLQCRGTDSVTVPAAQQVSPSTCWAPSEIERYTSNFGTAFPAWRVDRYGSVADRGQNPGTPSPRPASCGSVPASERWVHFTAANGADYPGGSLDCGGVPPEATAVDGTLSLPDNTTFAASDSSGSGSARFNIRDAQDNASIGCSDTIACALVAIPILGISCDVAGAATPNLPSTDVPTVGAEADQAKADCTQTGFYAPGALASSNAPHNQAAVSGSLWWSASNWRNRISFPLTLAKPGTACQQSGNSQVDVYGSELLIQATTQWQPGLCRSAVTAGFKHVQTGEPQARNLLGLKTIEAAFTSDPAMPGYSTPTAHAPVAVSGFAISYAVDDANQRSVAQLNLTPRLLAKLLTESYPAEIAIQSSYTYTAPGSKTADTSMRRNPLNLSLDPEFIALNPGIRHGVPNTEGAATLLSIASDSDVVQALTSYINADNLARSWLDGTPDPWGMTVNPNYRGISLPVNSWPLLDTFEPRDWYVASQNQCLVDSPSAYLPLVAAPMSRLASISLTMQFAIQNSQTVCYQPFQGTSSGEKLVARGRQPGGFRFMLAVTSLGDAERFALNTASLQTNSVPGPDTEFTSAANRVFVAPTADSLAAAARTLKSDASSKSWPIDYVKLRDGSANAAYPGLMVVYADVPTSGLPAADATSYSGFLSYVAGPGQIPGPAAGQLASGYLPITEANGLGQLARYTKAAAIAVGQQKGQVPTLDGVLPSTTPQKNPSATPSASTSSSVGNSVPGQGSLASVQSPATAVAAASTNSATPATAAGASGSRQQPLRSLGSTVGLRDGLSGALLILLIALVVLGPVAVPLIIFLTRRRSAL